MSKDMQMSIKMESELHDQFMAIATRTHRPAAQIIRDLMRSFIVVQQRVPNPETIAAIEAVERGQVHTYTSADELYRTLNM